MNIQELTDLKIDIEEELYESKNHLLDLLDQIKLLELELQNMGTYIGKKNDRIDQTLANYINKYPEKEKMNIMFIRESEGV